MAETTTTDTGAAVDAAPVPDTLTTTPSGIEIAYFNGSKGKRKYEVRQNLDGERAFPSEWLEVPSVTTVLGVLDKPALPWWGMKIGVQGVLELVDRGLVGWTQDGKLAVSSVEGWNYATDQNLVDMLNGQKLTVNHVRDQAGGRGTGVHDAFEAWAAVGTMPNPEEHPVEERGYVKGLLAFCTAVKDAWETDSVEVTVGSAAHGFAGRYDCRGRTTKPVRLVASALTTAGTPRVRGPKLVDVPPCSLLVDLKTSKGIYGTHLMQLEGYEGASIECGYGPTDARAVLHVTADGLYEFKRARATYDDFLAILATYHALERVKEALK